jgi:hypothetical protein
MKELADVGAVEVKMRQRPNGSWTSNEYVLQPLPRGGPPGVSGEGTPDRSGDKNETQEELEASTAVAVLARGEPPNLNREQADRIVERLAAECGVDLRSPRIRATAVAAATIRRHVGSTLTHPPPAEEFTELVCQQISGRADLYRERMDGARLTPTALANWWFDVTNIEAAKQQKRYGRGMTTSSILALRDEEDVT